MASVWSDVLTFLANVAVNSSGAVQQTVLWLNTSLTEYFVIILQILSGSPQ